jgi:hypothetical protein
MTSALVPLRCPTLQPPPDTCNCIQRALPCEVSRNGNGSSHQNGFACVHKAGYSRCVELRPVVPGALRVRSQAAYGFRRLALALPLLEAGDAFGLVRPLGAGRYGVSGDLKVVRDCLPLEVPDDVNQLVFRSFY